MSRVLAYCQKGHPLARVSLLDSDWWEADDYESGPRWLVAAAGSVMVEVPIETTEVVVDGDDIQFRRTSAWIPKFGPHDPLEDHTGEAMTLTCTKCRRHGTLAVDDLLAVRADLHSRPKTVKLGRPAPIQQAGASPPGVKGPGA